LGLRKSELGGRQTEWIWTGQTIQARPLK
jgi:hypothetical protein